MIIFIFLIAHWYFSLFFQTFFHHRYAAHGVFSMSRGWEKAFFILSWIGMGSSYLSPYIYSVLHRLHHAYADTEKDPHSPQYDPNLFAMMWRTRTIYKEIGKDNYPVPNEFKQNVPQWRAVDEFFGDWGPRIFWMFVYVGFYVIFATHWWMYLFLPIHFLMGPIHGVIINWFAHKYGYTNFKVQDTSKNLLPVDVLMLGESYHNNHHKNSQRANFGHRWFEIDPIYPIIRLFHLVRIIRLQPVPVTISTANGKGLSPSL